MSQGMPRPAQGTSQSWCAFRAEAKKSRGRPWWAEKHTDQDLGKASDPNALLRGM